MRTTPTKGRVRVDQGSDARDRSDSLAGLPDYAGSRDEGLRESLPPGAPALGDIVDLVTAEHRKLERLLSEMTELARTGADEELGQRWYGVVRELLEFSTA